MRILTICDSYPFPLTNGQSLRIYNYVQRLHGRHTFDLLCYGDPPIPNELKHLFRNITVFPQPSGRSLSPLAQLLRRMSASSDHLTVRSEHVAKFLADAVNDDSYDLLWFSGGGSMNHHLESSGPVGVLADIVDDLVLTQLRILRRARSPLHVLRHTKRLLTTFLFERSIFRNADCAVFVSEEDAAVFRRVCPRIPTSVVHNGVDIDYFVPTESPQSAFRLVFEGNMRFEPNVEAAEYLCNAILPRIWTQIPSVKLDIVGKDPTERVRGLEAPQVRVTGFVDDIRPYLSQAAVFVCPMLSGAGIKNKVLQAWAMGLPIVATPLAIGGLMAVHGENILISNDAASFAAAVVRVLQDRELSRRLGKVGRTTVLSYYDWSAKAAEFDKIFETAVSRAKKRRMGTMVA